MVVVARADHGAAFPEHQVVDMPALSPTMTQGNIGTWQKNAGDSIAPGDVLVEIETDKAQMDFEFQEEGFIAKVLLESGSKDVPVGSPIAILVENEDDVAAFAEFTIDDAGGKKEASKADTEVKEPEGGKPQEKQEDSTDSTPPAASDKESVSQEKSAPAPSPSKESTPASSGGRIFASPVARRLAEEKGIALRDVKGTGPEGRIVKADVENYKPSAGPAPSASKSKTAPADKPANVPAAGSAADATYTDIPLTGMRKTIAARLAESKQSSPHYYLTVSINMDKTLKLREALNSKANGRYKLSVNDFIVKATAQALIEVPEANSAWYGEFIRQNHNADICIAVATPNGLITPIVKQAQSIGLSTISNKTKELAKKARDGKLKPDEYQGGTFTISNLGMFGIQNFTAIINPPQACILAVGETTDVLTLDPTSERGFKASKVMQATLSSDHRVVDGAVGAKWTAAFKRIMENPLELLL
ncbi:Dihydrolipoyllysine-residue acetyltransferase component of pyruvate dehydrogenase complex, mitochondrial [Taphrina deformans PYCC 5710]|uniref:Acetyltransferase component of pyruvate dehydrogenase complex n=1 Tax=Taphrina deformans (strain PYCC 5710 / ATCC 11124 / CBS 356.35 / IMI 108563 / JCM 9778 / NBRC 8474) TaxID=1097556 RepID=R4X6H8_TAPDE|nr:Dihydrolipoyllysine-residue acetyltransferase component of pyruvate dehydrogenase complex, mitochondrial [Taphrina deformans PYCC 5710]|eukprot:CCG80729.1 Dihydrolipoyllysine-residue acetyltransferase component of pyruvate dehydrogenase complex, mitochondrial [Taphrina deformans PYCC 5710]